MNTPFTIALNVEEIGYNDQTPRLNTSQYNIRVTLRHYVRDIYHLIWFNSPNFSLKPLFLRITHNGTTVPDQQLYEILDTTVAPTTPVTLLNLVVDYTLYNYPIVRDPVEELFDVVIEWNDTRGNLNSINIRELLRCTIAVLQDYVAEERNKSLPDSPPVDGSYFNLRYWANDEVFRDTSVQLSDVVGLDVAPLTPVLFELSYNTEVIRGTRHLVESRDLAESPTRVRFFIKVNSDVPNLQNEGSLFEVNSTTTVRELVHLIIERADNYEVRRTFFDQVKLTCNGDFLTENPKYDIALYEILDLSESSLAQTRNVVLVDLQIHSHLSGVEGGILSREFWNDLTSDTRFQFLPSTVDDLAQVEGHESASLSIERFQPSRVVLEDGAEWVLSGDTFEMMDCNPLSVNPNRPPRQLLVDQSDLSSMVYEFTMTLPGATEPTSVSLNASQCIVVKDQGYDPYILLNPAGAAKLNRVFRDGESLLQQVQIHLYDPNESGQASPPPPPPPHGTGAPDTGAAVGAAAGAAVGAGPRPAAVGPGGPLGNVAAGGRQPPLVRLNDLTIIRILGIIIQFLRTRPRGFYFRLFGFMLFLFISGLDMYVMNNFSDVVKALGFIVFLHYIVVHSGATADSLTRLAERNIIPEPMNMWVADLGIGLRIYTDRRNEFLNGHTQQIIRFAVHRTRDYEHLRARFNGQQTLLYVVKENIKNFAKSVVLLWLTVPFFLVGPVENEIERFKSTANEDLKGDIEKLYDEFVKLKREYEEKFGAFGREFDISVLDAASEQIGEINESQENVVETDQVVDPVPLSYQEKREIEYQVFLDQLLKLQAMYNECAAALGQRS